MKKYILISLFVIVACSQLLAVFDDYEPSARARGLGGAFTALSDDATGIFYNPAGLRFAGNNIDLSYSEIFGLDFLRVSSASMSMDLPRKYGVIGFGMMTHTVEYKDVDMMSELQISLAHSFTIMEDIHSSLHFGYTANVYNLGFGEYVDENDESENFDFGDQTTFGINVGALAILRERTKLAFTASNINNPKFGKENEEDIPRKLAVAVAYEPYQGICTTIELKKAVGEDTQVRAGAEVEVHQNFMLRFGVGNNPSRYSMGFKVQAYNVIVNYAFNTHAALDMSHHFGIGYRF